MYPPRFGFGSHFVGAGVARCPESLIGLSSWKGTCGFELILFLGEPSGFRFKALVWTRWLHFRQAKILPPGGRYNLKQRLLQPGHSNQWRKTPSLSCVAVTESRRRAKIPGVEAVITSQCSTSPLGYRAFLIPNAL